jgi:hypothetical protein
MPRPPAKKAEVCAEIRSGDTQGAIKLGREFGFPDSRIRRWIRKLTGKGFDIGKRRGRPRKAIKPISDADFKTTRALQQTLDALWTEKETAGHLGVTQMTVSLWRRHRGLPAASVHGRHLYVPKDVIRWYAEEGR